MSFTDYLYVPLLLLSSLIYYLVPMKKRWIILLATSVLFFFTWGVELFPFALFSIIIAWLAAVCMDKAYEKQDIQIQTLNAEEKKLLRFQVKRKNKYILWFASAMIILVLVYTKTQTMLVNYSWGNKVVSFFSEIYQYVGRRLVQVPVIRFFVRSMDSAESYQSYSFFVPLGISYYTMSLVGYMADVYWRKERAEKNLGHIALFALYFPKILEGPISRHKNIALQLKDGHPFEYHRYCFGWQRILWGYFKKLVIADRLNIYVNEIFGNYQLHHGAEFLLAAVMGAFQLYCDFSGCMDIALGTSEIFGISLEENFKRPFFSKSAAEFWRRWHITLGTWFKDYIYMPLVISPHLIKASGRIKKWKGKRLGKVFMTVIPLSVVWLLTGLWHGTGWNYVVWGIYWGILIILSTVFEPEIRQMNKRLHLRMDSGVYCVVQRFRIFILFTISRILTIPSSLTISIKVFHSIATDFAPWKLVDGSIYKAGLDRPGWNVAVIALLVLWGVELKQERGNAIRESVERLPLIFRWLFWIIAIFVVLIFGVYGAGYDASSFVYMNY